MKLKVKLGRRQIIWIVVAVLAVGALLIGRAGKDQPQHSGLDAAADRACSDFSAGYGRAKTKAARLSLADKVMASSSKTDNEAISKRAAEMGRSADDSTAAWKAGADALTRACHDAGWGRSTTSP